MQTLIAYHLILSFYGFWLPNDLRGSWSDFVRAWELRKFGPATKTRDSRSHASDPHDVELRLAAKEALVREPVQMTGIQARAVGRGFARFVDRSGIKIHACAILPEHVHIVVSRHRYSIEQIARHLKADATTQLKHESLHPFVDQPYNNGNLPSPWVRHQWKCFIFEDEYLYAAVNYVKQNPLREGKRLQEWDFVTPVRAD